MVLSCALDLAHASPPRERSLPDARAAWKLKSCQQGLMCTPQRVQHDPGTSSNTLALHQGGCMRDFMVEAGGCACVDTLQGSGVSGTPLLGSCVYREAVLQAAVCTQ